MIKSKIVKQIVEREVVIIERWKGQGKETAGRPTRSPQKNQKHDIYHYF